MRKARGSNQFSTRWGLKDDTFASVVFLLGLIVLVVILFGTKPTIISPLADAPYVYASEPTPTPTPAPTLENIVAYIAKVFEPEGKQVVVKAIQCFYAESGLRPEAYNYNSNGTEDFGIAQINSIWGMKVDDAHDFRKNIDKAYEIYKRSHSFRPWYAKECR